MVVIFIIIQVKWKKETQPIHPTCYIHFWNLLQMVLLHSMQILIVLTYYLDIWNQIKLSGVTYFCILTKHKPKMLIYIWIYIYIKHIHHYSLSHVWSNWVMRSERKSDWCVMNESYFCVKVRCADANLGHILIYFFFCFHYVWQTILCLKNECKHFFPSSCL